MLYCNCFAKKGTLRKSGFTEPVEMAGIMMLFIIGVVTFPTRRIVEWIYPLATEHIFLFADGLERVIFTIVMIRFIKSFGFRVIPRKTNLITLISLIPALIVAVNNFPFVSMFMGECKVVEQPLNITFFAFWCVGVGMFEEVAFRGVILPLCLIKINKLKDGNPLKKRPVFFTLAISSAVFALTHLVNLLNGNIGGTFLQVGYTFLIGAMCGIITVKTGNVFISAIAHIIYNFCGMFIEYCGVGIMWTWQQIVCTAVVGVVCGIYLIIVAIRSDRSPKTLFDMLGDAPREFDTAEQEK